MIERHPRQVPARKGQVRVEYVCWRPKARKNSGVGWKMEWREARPRAVVLLVVTPPQDMLQHPLPLLLAVPLLLSGLTLGPAFGESAFRRFLRSSTSSATTRRKSTAAMRSKRAFTLASMKRHRRKKRNERPAEVGFGHE